MKFITKSIVAVFLCFFAINTQSFAAMKNVCEKQTSNNTIIKRINYSPNIDKLVGNYKNTINFVFSDIDGTLVPFEQYSNGAPIVAQETAKKLKLAHIPMILATGRSIGDTEEVLKDMNMYDTYVITLQGAEIFSPEKKLIYKDAICHKDTIKLLKTLEKIKKEYNLDISLYFFVNGKAYATEKYNIPYGVEKRTIIKSTKSLGNNFEASKIGIYAANPSDLNFIQTKIENNFKNYHIDISARNFCDITTFSATKGNAVKKLANILNINLKNTAVFGDAENDLSMLDTVKQSGGLAIAVGNAMPVVKQYASYTTLPVQQGGESYAIDKILENNKFIERTAPVIK